MKIIKSYAGFNERRYSNPWVAIVDTNTAKPDFKRKVGGYTGGYKCGEAGHLYVCDPVEGAVYMYGQKDYRGNQTERAYVQYRNGEFLPIESSDLLGALQG